MKKQGARVILSGALSLTASGLIVKALSLIYKIPLSYILTDEGMGYFNSAYTIYSFFYIICTAGLPKALSILISESEREAESRESEQIYRTALISFAVLGVFVSIIYAALAIPFAKIIGNRDAYLTMVAISPSIFFVSVSGVVRGYFSGKMSFTPIAVSEIISGGIRLALGVGLAYIGQLFRLDLPALSALTVLGTTLGAMVSCVYLIICKKTHLHSHKTGQNIALSFATLKKILAISIPITLASAVASLGGIIDLWVIMRGLITLGYTELQAGIVYGNYTTLVLPILNLVGALVAPVATVLLPLVARERSGKELLALSSTVTGVFRVVGFFFMPLAVLLFFKADVILELVFENGSAAMAAPFLMALAPAIPLLSVLTVVNTVLEGVGRARLVLFSLSFGLFVKLIVTYLLMRYSPLEMLSAPIGSCISYAVSLLICIFAFNKAFGVSVGAVTSSFPSLIIAIAASFGAQTIQNIFFAKAKAGTFAFLSIFAALYLVFSLLCLLISIKRKKMSALYTKFDIKDYLFRRK